MKLVIVATSALLLAVAPASAGGWGGQQSPSAPQFANSTALNYAKQIASIHAFKAYGGIKQVTGAGAESINKADCGCTGSQTATSFAKNYSFQVGTVKSGISGGWIDQSAVATSVSKNIRSGR